METVDGRAETDAPLRGPMIRPARRSDAHFEAIRAIKAWTRARFALTDDDPVAVAEVACGMPGCPPLETVVTFWTAPDRRHAFKVFKSVTEVTDDDLPPAFMKTAILSDGIDADCC